MERLRRSDCADPGYTRRKRGKGFEYFGPDGQRVKDIQVLNRVEALRIPPAWTEVWVCPDPMGHLQALGTDAAGRRQYLYHPRFRERRDREKFERMREFAKALPRIRKAVKEDLSGKELSRQQVLAAAARLLDLGFFRAGNDEYLRENDSCGLMTVSRKHVKVSPEGVITFDYPAKSGKRRIQTIHDADVAAVVRSLQRRRSTDGRLFACKSSERWVAVSAADLNAYIKEKSSAEFSAKDFRTWHATVLAAVCLAVSERVATGEASRKRAISYAIKEVSHYLGTHRQCPGGHTSILTSSTAFPPGKQYVPALMRWPLTPFSESPPTLAGWSGPC